MNRAMANYICHKTYFILFLFPLFRADNKGLPDILSNSQTCYDETNAPEANKESLFNSENIESAKFDQAA